MGIYNRKDFFYKKAKTEGYRSRAAYKLIELNKRYSLLKKGELVADLGCAPGGFLQVASEIVGDSGIVVGVDLSPVQPVGRNVFIITGDFTDTAVTKKMLSFTNGRRFNLILSDMAPKTSGILFRDSYLSFTLAQAAFNSTSELLEKGGKILIKIFESEEVKGFVERIKEKFEIVHLNRPESTRKGSKEIYIIGKNFIGV